MKYGFVLSYYGESSEFIKDCSTNCTASDIEAFMKTTPPMGTLTFTPYEQDSPEKNEALKRQLIGIRASLANHEELKELCRPFKQNAAIAIPRKIRPGF